MWKSRPICLLLLFSLVNADIYLHNPRGSNNRLNENSKTRRNNNRLFDSENNNNGGYNVGDATSAPSGGDETKQYQMKYFQSGPPKTPSPSVLTVEWTNQHGCGGVDPSGRKVNCNLVLQYMCQPDDGSVSKVDKFRAGVAVQSQPFGYRASQYRDLNLYSIMKEKQVKPERGLHENWEWYDRCMHRENNKGLFLADQNLRKVAGYSRAIHTRQNNNGQRSGYECSEERDYYPYWHPTPWIDIAVFMDDPKQCSMYRKNSFNSKPLEECVEKTTKGNEYIRRSRWNNKEECEKNNGEWLAFNSYLEKAPEYTDRKSCIFSQKKVDGVRRIWGLASDAKNVTKYECLVAPSPVLCRRSLYSRVNHLGNGLTGKANSFDWTLPYFPSGKDQRCVLRMRYNISTNDYDVSNTDASKNGDSFKNDPTVTFGNVTLQLAINTAQFGRTFQDRSHVFIMRPRPKDLPAGRIYNLNVRGKRGNIVQAYPAVEYDFTPNVLSIKENDYVHIQWTGSNTNPKNNAGEGRAGTDRSNFLQMKVLSTSFPLPLEETDLWKNSEVFWIHHGESGISSGDLAIDMASAGYYNCLSASSCPASLVNNTVGQKAAMNTRLDNAPASYEGALLKIKPGIYYYMCTRNNNFTNRSQKGILKVARNAVRKPMLSPQLGVFKF